MESSTKYTWYDVHKAQQVSVVIWFVTLLHRQIHSVLATPGLETGGVDETLFFDARDGRQGQKKS